MKKVLISIFTLIFIISMINVVNAATSGSVTLKLSATTIKAGDEITLTVAAEDSNNLNAVGYTGVNFTDSNGADASSKFQIVKTEKASTNVSGNITESSTTYYLMEAGTIQSSDIFTVTIKALDGITAGTYNINVNGLVVENKTHALGTAEEKATNIGTKSVQIKAVADETTIDNNKDTTDNNSESSNGSSSSSSSKSSTSSTTSSSKSSSNEASSKKLPQTGVEVGSIIGIVALSVIAIISYVSYKKYKNI